MGSTESVWCGVRFVDRLQVLAGALLLPSTSAPLQQLAPQLDGLLTEIPEPLAAPDFVVVRAVLITFLTKMTTHGTLTAEQLQRALDICAQSDAHTFRVAVECALSQLGCFTRLPATAPDPRVTLAVDYIRRHATTRSINVAAIAIQVRLSRWHLERLMRRHTGRTVMAHVRSARLLTARRLLAGTLLTVKEISAMSGYGSTSAFARDFKRSEGVSPLEWREVKTRLSATGRNALRTDDRAS